MGTGRSYNSPVRHVRPGESVTAGVTGRSTRALEQRSAYLKDRLDAIETGRALIDADVTLASSVLVGTPVYWNATDLRYEPAMAAAAVTPESSLEFSPGSFCVGICTDKTTSTSGSVTLFGLTTIPTLQNATSDTTPGLYYVSSINPGKLTRTRPQVAVPVCYVFGAKDACATTVTILVLPQFGSFFDDHIHYRFDLATTAAGDLTDDGTTYTITNPDISLPGWLPADHASFEGKAPAGAVFGYNLAYDTKLAGVWPPVPLTSATLVLDKADGLMGRVVANSLAIVDSNGIWWTSSCITSAPFSYPANSSSSSSSSSSAAAQACLNPTNLSFDARAEEPAGAVDGVNTVFTLNATPLDPDSVVLTVNGLLQSKGTDFTVVGNTITMSYAPASLSLLFAQYTVQSGVSQAASDLQLTLWFAHMLFVTDKTVVRSLLSRSPLLIITDCNNEPAIAGELEIDFNLGLLVQDTDFAGGEVMKVINTDGNIERGWVAEGLIAGNEEVELTSTRQRYLDPEDNTSDVVHQGIVTVQFLSNVAERDIAPQIVYLNDALERDYNDITYIAFPSARTCEIRMRINVPAGGLPDNPVMLIRSQIFGLATGPFSNMTATYRVIARANVATTPVVGATTALLFKNPATGVASAQAISTATAALPSAQIKEIETEEFEITAGCTVFVTFARAANATPVYNSEIGFMRIGGIIRSASVI